MVFRFRFDRRTAVVYYAAVRFIMNSVRTGGRAGSESVINEPGKACFPGASLPQMDLRRPRGNQPRNLISDWQSLIKRSGLRANVC